MVTDASSPTGRLIAEELTSTPLVLLTGSDEAALSQIERTTGLQTILCDADGLGAMLRDGDVLLSTHTAAVNECTVLAVAVASNATYLGLAVDDGFLRHVFTTVHRQAALRRTTLLPSVGYRSLVGHMVADQALDAAGPEGRILEVAYLVLDGQGEHDGVRRGLPGLANLGAVATTLREAVGHRVTTYRNRHLELEPVGTRMTTFVTGGRRHRTVSVGGAEIWTLPGLHPELHSVDVHSGSFGRIGPVVSLGQRLAWPIRTMGVDRLVEHAVRTVVGAPVAEPRERGALRVVARVADIDGQVVAQREAVGSTPRVVGARLAAACADAMARTDVRHLPVGATDPLSVFGREGLTAICNWAGVVLV